MVYFILYHIKFKYLIGDYNGARSAREGGRGIFLREELNGQTAARSAVSGGDKKATKLAIILNFNLSVYI